MTPAAYTPTTLDRIRQGATASQLGWTQDRFDRICAKHGIHVGPIAKPALDVEGDCTAGLTAAQARRVAPHHPPKIPPSRRQKRRGMTTVDAAAIDPSALPLWNFDTCEFVSGSLKVVIAGRVQARALNELYNSWRTDPLARVSRAVLASASGTTPASISTSMRDLSARLRRVGWQAKGYKSLGGWRLERFIPGGAG